MSEHTKGHRKAPHETHKHKEKGKTAESKGKSEVRLACMHITRAVRAGVLTAALATKAMTMMGCGARTELPTDDMVQVDDHDHDAGVGGEGGGCMGVDAGPCMGVDAGGSKGIDMDAGGSKGIDAGGSKGIDDPSGSMA